MMIFIILYKNNGKFSLKDDYENKENFVVIMNDYISIIFLIFVFASIIINILLKFRVIIILKAFKKILLILFYFLIYFIYYTLFLYKITYSEFKDTTITGLEMSFIHIFSYNILISFIITICILYDIKKNKDEVIIPCLKQIKGINIIDYDLPLKVFNLNEKEKYELIFKKENIKWYGYKLSDNQINLIYKINEIRIQYSLNPFEFYRFEKAPEFLINENTELHFYPFQNIFKLSKGFYIFKYPKNELINLFSNKEILNIITNNLLDKIYIIEKNDFVFICPYSKFYTYKKVKDSLRKKIIIITQKK